MKETLPKSIQELILSLREKLKDEPEIVDMFERCYSNTLDTTVKKMEDGSTYVITGDIPAMWLRDSVAQLRPYLVPAQNDPELADLIAGSSAASLCASTSIHTQTHSTKDRMATAGRRTRPIWDRDLGEKV